MPLTADQKAKIKKILAKHQRDVRLLVQQHKQAVVNAVMDLEKKKIEGIRKQIG